MTAIAISALIGAVAMILATQRKAWRLNREYHATIIVGLIGMHFDYVGLLRGPDREAADARIGELLKALSLIDEPSAARMREIAERRKVRGQ